MTVEAPWGFCSTWQPAGPSTGSGHICPTPRDAGFLPSPPHLPCLSLHDALWDLLPSQLLALDS